MAARRIPDALAMRETKYGDKPAAEKDRVAQDLAAQGRHAEAILLFDGRGDHPFLAGQRKRAASDGDAFTLLSLRRMGTPVSDDDLRACAAAAEKAGRWLDARQCHVALKDEASLVRISPNLPEGLRVEATPPSPAA
jgi:hypothetical protein